MKSWKKAVPMRKYRERSQPQRREKLGLLEKKKDYKERAKNYHEKEKALSIISRNFVDKLREKAALKNPDEFYMKMTKARMADNKLVLQNPNSKKGNKTRALDQAKSISLVHLKHSIESHVWFLRLNCCRGPSR